jgi:hypothetical protein
MEDKVKRTNIVLLLQYIIKVASCIKSSDMVENLRKSVIMALFSFVMISLIINPLSLNPENNQIINIILGALINEFSKLTKQSKDA